MSEKIAEIRERHAQSDNNFIEYESTWDIHADRATLLAEDERQRAEIERLLQAIGLATTAVPDMQVDIENPVGMMQRVVAEVDRLRADRRERIATAALQGLLSNPDRQGSFSDAVRVSVEYADALAAKLDREEGKP